jgi:hypothetical protein
MIWTGMCVCTCATLDVAAPLQWEKDKIDFQWRIADLVRMSGSVGREERK